MYIMDDDHRSCINIKTVVAAPAAAGAAQGQVPAGCWLPLLADGRAGPSKMRMFLHESSAQPSPP